MNKEMGQSMEMSKGMTGGFLSQSMMGGPAGSGKGTINNNKGGKDL
jgi:hypothetical protein